MMTLNIQQCLIIIVAFGFILQHHIINCITLEYALRPKQSKCFEEYFVKESGLHIDVETLSNSQPVLLQITDESNNKLYQKTDNKHLFTRENLNKSESYTMCFDNPNKLMLKLIMNIYSGFEADEIIDKLKHQDYVMNSELQRYTNAIDKTITMVHNLGKEANLLSDQAMAQADDITAKLMVYTGFTIVWLVGMGSLYVCYMKAYLKKKKLI